jgi:NADH:ubiquinone oxidoreductase subunit 3 (subunit A)
MAGNRKQLEEVVARSLEAQAKLWPATKAAVQQEGNMPAPLKASLVQAVNNVLDAHTSRMAVIYDRLPGAVLALLMLIAAASMALAAYNAGLTGLACRWRMSAFAVILAALMFVILDFDIVLRGFIRVNHESLASLIREMEAALLP